MNRLKDAAEKAKIELSNLFTTEINLPIHSIRRKWSKTPKKHSG
ncbi:MAG: Hsp70 family protein [Candidatus Eiseniibacteriota bacterium]